MDFLKFLFFLYFHTVNSKEMISLKRQRSEHSSNYEAKCCDWLSTKNYLDSEWKSIVIFHLLKSIWFRAGMQELYILECRLTANCKLGWWRKTALFSDRNFSHCLE